MVTRLRGRRGAIWTFLAVGGALGLGAAYSLAGDLTGMIGPGVAVLAVGALVAGSSATRTRARGGRAGVAAGEAVARRKRTLIVGSGEVAQSLAREFERTATHEVIGFVDDLPPAGGAPTAGGSGAGQPLLGTREELLVLAERHGVDEVIIAEAPSWLQQLVERTVGRQDAQFNVRLVPSLYETAIGRLPREQVRDIPLLAMAPWQRGAAYEAARRVFDVGFSCLAIAFSAPLMLLSALAIKLTDGGAVLFRQDRVGLDGETFTMLKLRTMVLDAERDGPSLCSGYDDRRLTAVGRLLRKTRLDEVPQFFNVLRGEMSVIGPRPERPCFVERFQQQIPGYHERHRIRPGITGLAQVNGHYLSSARDKLRYDLFYLYHRGPWLDLRVLMRTIGSMIH